MSGDQADSPPPQKRAPTDAEIAEWLAKNYPPPPGHIGLLTKLPPIPAAAWSKLWAGLLDATYREKQGFDYPDAPPGFMASEGALRAVNEFLVSFDGLMKEGALIPLLRLAEALRDLDEGRKPALLASRPKGGRPGTDYRRSAVIGYAARCLTELMAAGEGADAAARKVVAAARAGGAVGAEAMTAAKIKNWRARCMEGEPGANRATISHLAWRHYAEPLSPDLGATPAERGEKLLFMLSTASARGLGERISQQPLMFPRKTSG